MDLLVIVDRVKHGPSLNAISGLCEIVRFGGCLQVKTIARPPAIHLCRVPGTKTDRRNVDPGKLAEAAIISHANTRLTRNRMQLSVLPAIGGTSRE